MQVLLVQSLNRYTSVGFVVIYFYALEHFYLNTCKTTLSSKCLTAFMSSFMQRPLALIVPTHGNMTLSSG